MLKKLMCCAAVVALIGCADVPTDEDLEGEGSEAEGEERELGLAASALEKIVYRSINAGDLDAVYYGAGKIEVKLRQTSRAGAALELRNKSGTPVTIPYSKITVKCENGSGDWTWNEGSRQLKGGDSWGHTQLCQSKLVSASIEVKIVRP